MRLAAVYLPINSLPFVFGKNHMGQTINLGGEFNYMIKEKAQKISIIQTETNDNFIEGFFGNNIALITAIVGRNGIGKTTILRGINHSADNKKIDALYLFEKSNNTHAVYNELDIKEISTSLKIEDIETKSLDIFKHYYSPILDYEILDTKSSFSLAESGDETLYSNYLRTINKSISLLNDPVIKTIKNVYPDFPSYDSTKINVRNHRKDFFQDVYARANLGNKERADVAKIYIEDSINKIKRGDYDSQLGGKEFWIKILEGYVSVINSKSFNSLFDDIWALEEYDVNNEERRIHDTKDFLKDFEISILSYLLLGAVFPSTPYQRDYEFSKVLNSNSFQERLNKLLELYLSNVYGDVYDGLKEKFKEVDINNYESILQFIENPIYTKFDAQGFKSKDAIKLMIHQLNLFKAVNDFYLYLKDIIENGLLKLDDGALIYDFNEHKESSFNDFVSNYQLLLSKFGRLPANVVLFDFKPTKVLSSGEKALLNFYATIHGYVNRIKNSKHQHLKYYLLLLDEPELGYHPYWKKKFVDAMSKILPVLFEKINPTIGLNGEITDQNVLNTPKLQIIFTTHDPLTLSDIPNHNVIYLDKIEKSDISRVVSNNLEFKKSFGANITDLLADSFFVDDGLIGDFAKKKIEEILNNLYFLILRNEIKDLSNDDKKKNKEILQIKKAEFMRLEESITSKDSKHIKSLIDIVDEPILKYKLEEMYDQAFPNNVDKKEALSRAKDILGRAGLDIDDLIDDVT